MKELDAGELAAQEEQHLAVDIRDAGAAKLALVKAGIEARLDGKDSLFITDEQTLQHPDRVATLLVEAGVPPTRLVIEQRDLESYFLKLVGLKEGEGDE